MSTAWANVARSCLALAGLVVAAMAPVLPVRADLDGGLYPDASASEAGAPCVDLPNIGPYNDDLTVPANTPSFVHATSGDATRDPRAIQLFSRSGGVESPIEIDVTSRGLVDEFGIETLHFFVRPLAVLPQGEIMFRLDACPDGSHAERALTVTEPLPLPSGPLSLSSELTVWVLGGRVHEGEAFVAATPADGSLAPWYAILDHVLTIDGADPVGGYEAVGTGVRFRVLVHCPGQAAGYGIEPGSHVLRATSGGFGLDPIVSGDLETVFDCGLAPHRERSSGRTLTAAEVAALYSDAGPRAEGDDAAVTAVDAAALDAGSSARPASASCRAGRGTSSLPVAFGLGVLFIGLRRRRAE